MRAAPVALLLWVAACQAVAPTTFSSDIDELLARGQSFAHALGQPNLAQPEDEQVIALGYLERARLGMGSPFRLIAFLRRDERLAPEIRERVAYAVLSEALAGRVYHVDPAVLDALRLTGVPPSRPTGEFHLELIERTIAEAETPQSGERAVRMGYMLAGLERSVEGVPESVVAHVAAMVADRRRVQDDAVELLRTAAQLRTDPLELLEEWRAELRFRVERPALSAVRVREEIDESRRGTQVAAAIRVLAQRLSAPSLRRAPTPVHDYWGESWLPGRVAVRLTELAAEHDYPAQAPIAVAVAINRTALLERPGLAEWQRSERAVFAQSAHNEERLIAGAAQLRASGAGIGPRLPLILLQSAVFLRGWNQEDPWFAGDPAPSTRDLETRFGLASLGFDSDVPEAWRPYYRRMLGRAFGDLQRVLPTASIRGLNVRIGQVRAEIPALALHDPRTRTLTLPPETGAGTIAHEIAHDLDWQLARKRYARRGSYATDLAVQAQKGDRIASSVAGLAASLAREPGVGASTPHDERPAEVFARSADWLVATHLAREGRAGGYLTSYQDAALAGYGTTRGPHVDGNAVPALLAILEQIAPLPADARQHVLETHGPVRTLTAKELVRAITATAHEGSPYQRLTELETARDRILAGLSASSCRMVPSTEARRVLTARHQVIHAAVAAAARGIVIDAARTEAGLLEDPPSRKAVDELLVWRFDGGPEPAESGVHQILPFTDELMLRAAAVSAPPMLDAAGFEFQPERALCGGNPFASPWQVRRGGWAEHLPIRAP